MPEDKQPNKILTYKCCDTEYTGTKAELIGMVCNWCGKWIPNNSDSHDGEIWPDEFDGVLKAVQKDVFHNLLYIAEQHLDYHMPVLDEGSADYDHILKDEIMDAFMAFMIASIFQVLHEDGLEDDAFRNFKPYRFKDKKRQKQLDDFLSRLNLGYRLSFKDYFGQFSI
jgi:hypothetical protein